MTQSCKAKKQWLTALVLITAFVLGTFTLFASSYDEKRVKKLSKQLTAKSDKKRKEAVKELGAMNDYRVVPLLLKAMDDRSFSIKRIAIDAFQKINDPQAADALLAYLKEPWKESFPSVSVPVHQAIRALIETKDSRAGECFLTHLNNTSYPGAVRAVAASALLEIGHQVAYMQINKFMKSIDIGKSSYKKLVKKLIQIKDARFLDLYKRVMTMEHSDLRGKAAKNVLELADKADTQVLEKARSILQEYSYLEELTTYDIRKRPVSAFLSNLEGKPVAKRTISYLGVDMLSKAKVTTIDTATGEVLHEIQATVTASEILTPFLCLDERGNIILKDGKPVIIERFGAIRKTKSFFSRIGTRLVSRTRHIYPCKNCSKTTGTEKCRYVW